MQIALRGNNSCFLLFWKSGGPFSFSSLSWDPRGSDDIVLFGCLSWSAWISFLLMASSFALLCPKDAGTCSNKACPALRTSCLSRALPIQTQPSPPPAFSLQLSSPSTPPDSELRRAAHLHLRVLGRRGFREDAPPELRGSQRQGQALPKGGLRLGRPRGLGPG